MEVPSLGFARRTVLDELARDNRCRVYYAGISRTGGVYAIVEKTGGTYIIERDGFTDRVDSEPIMPEMPIIAWPPGGDVLGEGDVIIQSFKSGAKRRWRVTGHSTRGMLRMVNEDTHVEIAKWWKTRADLPAGYSVEGD